MILSGIPNTNTLCVIVQGRKEGLWSSEKENPPVPETFSLSLSPTNTHLWKSGRGKKKQSSVLMPEPELRSRIDPL